MHGRQVEATDGPKGGVAEGLSFSLSLCFPLCFPLSLSVSLSLCLSFFLSSYPSKNLSIYPSPSLSHYLSSYLSIFCLSINLSQSLVSISLFLSLSLSPSPCRSQSLSLSLPLSLYLSNYLSINPFIHLSEGKQNKQICETSFKSGNSQVQNESKRSTYFLKKTEAHRSKTKKSCETSSKICHVQHQKGRNSARHPSKMKNLVQGWRFCVKALCDSIPSVYSIAPATKKWGQVTRSAAPVTQNHLSKPEDWRSDAPKCNPSQEISAVTSQHSFQKRSRVRVFF